MPGRDHEGHRGTKRLTALARNMMSLSLALDILNDSEKGVLLVITANII